MSTDLTIALVAAQGVMRANPRPDGWAIAEALIAAAADLAAARERIAELEAERDGARRVNGWADPDGDVCWECHGVERALDGKRAVGSSDLGVRVRDLYDRAKEAEAERDEARASLGRLREAAQGLAAAMSTQAREMKLAGCQSEAVEVADAARMVRALLEDAPASHALAARLAADHD